ncbi:MAG: hypothetical protein LW669_10280 [Sphingobacteriales bacterium]|nr:hypothetical protein [Sphingobacteriales bacterium]
MNQNNMDNQSEPIESYLHSLNREGGMTVGEAYFAELEKQIMQRVLVQEKSVKLPFISHAWMSAAALILLTLFVFLFRDNFNTIESRNSVDIEFVADQLSNTELSEELLCDAGWCLELDQLLLLPDTSMSIDAFKQIESELMFEDL